MKHKHILYVILTLLFLSFIHGCSNNSDPPANTNSYDQGSGPNGAQDQGPFSSAEQTGPLPFRSMTISAEQNAILTDTTCQITPSQVANVAGGNYTISLQSSSLSKGKIDLDSGTTDSIDNYVIIHLPLGKDDSNLDHQYFMLNGIGASSAFSLKNAGTIQSMFVDSDLESNAGEATIALSPGDKNMVVNAMQNVLSWKQRCNASPATIGDIPPGTYSLELKASSLINSQGVKGDYVLLRLPDEKAQDDFRYVILNGVGATRTLTLTRESGQILGWFIDSGKGSISGEASIELWRK